MPSDMGGKMEGELGVRRGVLVVDDEGDIREILREALEWSGYAVSTANDGQEALEVLAKMEKPGVIYLDLMMPRMSGTEFMARKKDFAQLADVPVVIISADGEIEKKTAAIGADGFMKKPIDLDKLLRLTENYF
jgi:CheY-like chemotaxis protein